MQPCLTLKGSSWKLGVRAGMHRLAIRVCSHVHVNRSMACKMAVCSTTDKAALSNKVWPSWGSNVPSINYAYRRSQIRSEACTGVVGGLGGTTRCWGKQQLGKVTGLCRGHILRRCELESLYVCVRCHIVYHRSKTSSR